MQIHETQYTNPSFLQKLTLDLIKPRKSNYAEDCINYYMHDNKFVLEDIPNLKNKYNNLLKATLIKHRVSLFDKIQSDFALNKNKTHTQQKCIVYLHGLGSNRMEGFSILPHLPKNYSLFTFDLSGSGKSQGQFTSYGFREQQDIQAVLNYLYKTKNYRIFIIWGRSMGAVSSLLFNNKLNEKQNEELTSQQVIREENQNYIPLRKLSQFVKCIIADSPFCSFQIIAKDIALKKMSIPHLFTQIALMFIQSSFRGILQDRRTGQNFTPFQIDFTKMALKPTVPIVFVYSLNDEIVSCEHSQKIIKSIQKSKQKMVEKIVIPQCSHNSKRPQIVIETIFQKIQKFCNLKNEKIINDQNKNKKPKDNYFQTQNNCFQKQTKMVRRKSFWNFQEQFNQTQKLDTTIINKNQTINQNQVKKNIFTDDKMINEKPTVRRSIFQRKQSSSILNGQVSTIKKRGLSLSSTIQRTQSTYKQNNFLRKASIEPNKISGHQRNQKNQTKDFKRLRQISLDVKSNDKNRNQQNKNQSNKKFMDRFNRDCFDQNFSKTIDSRYSQVRNSNTRNRIYLGGSKQGKRLDSRQVIEMNLHNKNLNRLGNKYMFPDDMESKKQNNNLYSSIISEYGQIYNSKLSVHEIPSKDSSICMENQYISSEPNIIHHQGQFQRTSSRQYLRTIELGGMREDINQDLAKFINNKLQFQFDNCDVVNKVFNKSKINNVKEDEQKIKAKQSSTMGENDEKFLSLLRENKDVSSTINVPSHSSSFRPSIRLYNEKRKKKVQAQHTLYNKIQQNIQITNQRYLIED